MRRAAAPIIVGCPSTMGDDYQLNTTTLIRHATRTHPQQEIVYRNATGGWDRYSYGDCYARVSRAANALRALDVRPGDRIGVLDWNSRRHLELYFAIAGLGAVMLQLNLRLGADDLSYVIGHSAAQFILVDETLLPLAEAIAPRAAGVRGWIVMSDKPRSAITTTLLPLLHHEELLADAAVTCEWPVIDEHSACSACYTTGTTGRPKGVYYSHRAIYLHSLTLATNLGMSLSDCTMLLTPMFHAQCWGLPHAAMLMANKIVLPGRYLLEDTPLLVDTLIAEGVTVTCGAPSIFQPMLHYIETLPRKPDLSRLRMLCGSSEPPLSMMLGLHEHSGAEVIQGYGATETSPLVTMNRLKPTLQGRLTPEQYWNLKRKQGILVAGIDMKILGPNDAELPWDGQSIGEICLRGAWVATSYHDLPDCAERFIDGYWRSGDVGSMDADGYLKLTDRIKDVIKSGGEWISSIDMENALLGHPAVRDAAVVGLPHPQWQERPLALIVLKPGHQVTATQLRAHLTPAFAKWQLPDRMLFVNNIAKTSVGKLDKKAIRAQYASLYTPQGESPQEHPQR